MVGCKLDIMRFLERFNKLAFCQYPFSRNPWYVFIVSKMLGTAAQGASLHLLRTVCSPGAQNFDQMRARLQHWPTTIEDAALRSLAVRWMPKCSFGTSELRHAAHVCWGNNDRWPPENSLGSTMRAFAVVFAVSQLEGSSSAPYDYWSN